jgi:hypothetical protein
LEAYAIALPSTASEEVESFLWRRFTFFPLRTLFEVHQGTTQKEVISECKKLGFDVALSWPDGLFQNEAAAHRSPKPPRPENEVKIPDAAHRSAAPSPWWLSPRNFSQFRQKFLHFHFIQRSRGPVLDRPDKAPSIPHHAPHGGADGPMSATAGIQAITLNPAGFIADIWYIPHQSFLEASIPPAWS